MSGKSKTLTLTEAKTKAARFCAYQERTQQELRMKLQDWGVPAEEGEMLIVELISEGFVNEERFSVLFSGGKFRQNKWGRNKIRLALQQKGLTDRCIESGLSSIDPDDYRQTMLKLLKNKFDNLQENDPFVRKHKTAQYLIGKGFEPDLIWEALADY